MIILLDLNFTLVGNSRAITARTTAERIEQEEYRPWLVELVREHYTVLITARPVKHRQRTLEALLRATGWQPQEAIFNPYRLRPHNAKHRLLVEQVLPRHGTDGAAYLAIESNPRTRAVYERYGIRSCFITEGEKPWKKLSV